MYARETVLGTHLPANSARTSGLNGEPRPCRFTYLCVKEPEFVSARPTDSKTGAFSFGRARGVIEGVCGALAIPIRFLTPPTWKRIANVEAGVENKDQARARAIARW